MKLLSLLFTDSAAALKEKAAPAIISTPAPIRRRLAQVCGRD